MPAGKNLGSQYEPRNRKGVIGNLTDCQVAIVPVDFSRHSTRSENIDGYLQNHPLGVVAKRHQLGTHQCAIRPRHALNLIGRPSPQLDVRVSNHASPITSLMSTSEGPNAKEYVAQELRA